MSRLGNYRSADYPLKSMSVPFTSSGTLYPLLDLTETDTHICLSGPSPPKADITQEYQEDSFTLEITQIFQTPSEEFPNITHCYPETLIGRSEHTFTIPQGIVEPLSTQDYEGGNIHVKLLKKNSMPEDRENA